MAVLRALAVCRLDRGARVVITTVDAGKRVVIGGATGMVGGYAATMVDAALRDVGAERQTIVLENRDIRALAAS